MIGNWYKGHEFYFAIVLILLVPYSIVILRAVKDISKMSSDHEAKASVADYEIWFSLAGITAAFLLLIWRICVK